MDIILFIVLLNGMLALPYVDWDRLNVQRLNIDTESTQTGIPYYCDGVFVKLMEI